jgi:hypothetical protein
MQLKMKLIMRLSDCLALTIAMQRMQPGVSGALGGRKLNRGEFVMNPNDGFFAGLTNRK